jgi:hypothetical protein
VAVVDYFGLFAEEFAWGDEGGRAEPGRRAPKSRRGNDLVRKHRWNAATTATLHYPAVRALDRRLTQRGRRGNVGLGHGMRQLVHLVHVAWEGGHPSSAHQRRGISQGFHPPCGGHGNVLDLRAAAYRLPLREAALHLARTFDLPLTRHREEEPVGGVGTEWAKSRRWLNRDRTD